MVEARLNMNDPIHWQELVETSNVAMALAKALKEAEYPIELGSDLHIAMARAELQSAKLLRIIKEYTAKVNAEEAKESKYRENVTAWIEENSIPINECAGAAPQKPEQHAYQYSEENCPGHVAAYWDTKICLNCGTHIDSLRPE